MTLFCKIGKSVLVDKPEGEGDFEVPRRQMPETHRGHKYFVGGQTWKEYHEGCQAASRGQQKTVKTGLQEASSPSRPFNQGQLRSGFSSL